MFLFWSGGIALASFLGFIGFLQVYELREMLKNKGIKLPLIILLLSIITFFTTAFPQYNLLESSFILVFIILFANELIFHNIDGAVKRVGSGIFVLIYSSVFLGILFRISEMNNGKLLILCLLISIWITDTFAYFVGIMFGKHRGIFKVSPNKSLEGFLGGIFFSVSGSFIFSRYFGLDLSLSIAAAVSAGIFGQFGDLFESLLKRDTNVKDSSGIIPGHGGILDRFDSILFAAPVFYLIIKIIG